MISLIFTRKKLLVGISGKVTEFLEIDGSPFIEFGYHTPAETLEENLNEILNEYRYYLNRNGGEIPAEIDLSILYPNDRPAAELAQIQEIIRRCDHSLSIIHIDSLVLPYLYGMSHYDEIISAPCIVLEALDNYISLLYFHNPKKVNGSFLPIEENNLPTEYLKEKLSPQRLESMGIRQVFLLGKYLYNDFVLDFLENDLSLGDFIVRKNTSHLTDYKFMIKGSQRRMKDFSINPSERLSDWNKTLARIQIPISKKEIKQQDFTNQIPDKAEDLSDEVTSREDTFTRLSGKIDKWKLEITPNEEIEKISPSKSEDIPTPRNYEETTEPVEAIPSAGEELNPDPVLPTPERDYKTEAELEQLRIKIDKQTELYDKMANSFEESARRAQESMSRVRETEGEIKRLKKVLESKEEEVLALNKELATTQSLVVSLEGRGEDSDAIQTHKDLIEDLKNEVKTKEEELQELKTQIEVEGELKESLSAKEKEVEKLQEQLKEANELKTELDSRNEKVEKLENQIHSDEALKEVLSSKEKEIEKLQDQLKSVEELKAELETKNEEVVKLQSQVEISDDLKAELEKKNKEIETLTGKLEEAVKLKTELDSKGEEIEGLQGQLTTAESFKKQLEAKEIEVFDLQRKLKRITVLEIELESKEQEIKSLQERLEKAVSLESELEKKKREINLLTEDQSNQKEAAEYLKRKILVLEDKVKAHEMSLNDKDADLEKFADMDKIHEENEKEKNSLKQELELLLSRYKIQQELLANKDQEFIEYKDQRIDADLELKKQITAREDEIESIKEDIKNRQFKHNDELKVHLAEIDELRSNVDSRDHKIGKLVKEQEKLVAQNSDTESNLNDRILELKALSVRLKVKELEVQELEQGHKSREEEISDLNRQLIAKNQLISEKESDNQQIKSDANVLKDQIRAVELKLRKSEGDIKVREDEIVILKKEINQLKVDAENIYRANEKQKFHFEEKVKSLRDEITSRDEKIGQLDTTIRQKEKEIQEEINKYKIEKESKQVLSDKLLALSKKQEELKRILKEKEETLSRVEPELEKSKVRLLDLSSVIEEQRTAEAEFKTQIVEQDKKLSNQEKELAEKVKDLTKVKDRFADAENQLAKSKKQIEEHSKAIVNLNKTLEGKKVELIDLKENIKKSDDEIVELKAKLDLSTSRWADIGLALKGRDEHIIQLEDELLSLREVKKVLSTDIDQANFELNDAKAKVKVYIAERNVAEARANELSLQVKRLESLSNDNKSGNEQVSDLQSTIRSLNKELTTRDSKIQQFRNELGSKEKEIDQLSKRIDNQREDLLALKKAGVRQGSSNIKDKGETAALTTRLNLMKAELQVKDKELKELQASKKEFKLKLQKLEESKSAGTDQSRFQKMIEGKNEVIRALKIKLGEKDKELRVKELGKAGKLNNSEEVKTLSEKLKNSEIAYQKLQRELETVNAQLEDQQALRQKLMEMEKEMVVQRGRTKSRLEALEAELTKAFGEKIEEPNDLNAHNKFQKTV